MEHLGPTYLLSEDGPGIILENPQYVIFLPSVQSTLMIKLYRTPSTYEPPHCNYKSTGPYPIDAEKGHRLLPGPRLSDRCIPHVLQYRALYILEEIKLHIPNRCVSFHKDKVRYSTVIKIAPITSEYYSDYYILKLTCEIQHTTTATGGNYYHLYFFRYTHSL